MEFVRELQARATRPHIAIQGYATKTGNRRKTGITGVQWNWPSHPLAEMAGLPLHAQRNGSGIG